MSDQKGQIDWGKVALGALGLIAGGFVIKGLFDDDKPAPPPRMVDCSDVLARFYNECVRLSAEDQARLRGHRDANRERLKAGLARAGRPQPLDFISQGSYDMDTIIQHPAGDYDLDDGVVFAAEDLVGARGAKLTPLQVRKMVCDALQDERFKVPPKARRNCVRVEYNEGYHIDVPVYRLVDDDGLEHLELASTSWIRSAPREVTSWFTDAVAEKSPDMENGRQLRRVVRLLKAWAKSRASWGLPSGFVMTALAVELYTPEKNRDDIALMRLLVAMKQRLDSDTTVRHPVLKGEVLSKNKEVAAIKRLREQLSVAIDQLAPLSDRKTCDEDRALAAWSDVFDDEFFEDFIDRNEV